MEDFCDGKFFKDHPVFKRHPNALQFILYYDDIEVANPLGSRSGVHKIGREDNKGIRHNFLSRLLLLYFGKHAACFSLLSYCHSCYCHSKNE